MVPISAVPGLVRATVDEWRNTRSSDLLFAHHHGAAVGIGVDAHSVQLVLDFDYLGLALNGHLHIEN